MKIFKSEI